MPARLKTLAAAAALALPALALDDPVLPGYRVDLRQSPEERWTGVLEDFVGLRGTRAWRGFYQDVLAHLNATAGEAMSYAWAHLREWKDAYAEHNADALGEIRALAAVLSKHAQDDDERWLFAEDRVFLAHQHMEIGNMAPAPSLAEDMECTSVVVRRPPGFAGKEGATTLHFRNWDFGPNPLALGTASAMIDFIDLDGSIFRCALALTHITKWTTCLRPGAFSMTLDARGQGAGIEHGRKPEDELRLLAAGRMPRVAVLRHIMRAKSYAEAVEHAAAARPLTSLYAILADGSADSGQNAGGAIVTLIGNGTSADVMVMPNRGEEDDWFLVQTNVDHWEPMGPYSSFRRDHVVSLLRQLGPQASTESLYRVLHNTDYFPEGTQRGQVFRNTTILSALMEPTAGPQDSAFRSDLWRSLPPAAGTAGAKAAAVYV